MSELFRKVAAGVSCALGSPWAFFAALLLIVVWLAAGPLVGYSEDWQLVVNTITTIATFLMLFLVQNTQNRDTKAINIKLDELLRAIAGARTGLANVGDLSDAQLEKLEGEFRSLASDSPIASSVADQLEDIRQRGDETEAPNPVREPRVRKNLRRRSPVNKGRALRKAKS